MAPLPRPIEERFDRSKRVTCFARRREQPVEDAGDVPGSDVLHRASLEGRKPVALDQSLGLLRRPRLVAHCTMRFEECRHSLCKIRRRREVRILVFEYELGQSLPRQQARLGQRDCRILAERVAHTTTVSPVHDEEAQAACRADAHTEIRHHVVEHRVLGGAWLEATKRKICEPHLEVSKVPHRFHRRPVSGGVGG